jgi:hypothetical protein
MPQFTIVGGKTEVFGRKLGPKQRGIDKASIKLYQGQT